MNEKRTSELLNSWIYEQKTAYIKGWDFSHIRNRYKEEEDFSWDFYEVIKNYLRESDYLLDMETGGGEFLLSFNHNPNLSAAIEGYEPNIKICEKRLLPLGINFKACDGGDRLPFENECFDIITNRHGDYDVNEIKRVLKKGGIFLTQQVGAQNDRELVELLLGDIEIPFKEAYLEIALKEFENKGFEILERSESHGSIEFYDVGALVWFARIIEWEFPGFCVEKYQQELFKVQEVLEKEGVIRGRTHRYYFVARKI